MTSPRTRRPAAPRSGPALVYVYAVVASERAPKLANAPAPMPGADRVRVIDARDGLWLAVSDAPADAYSAAAIEAGLRDMAWISDRALAHEAMVEFFGRANTVIPMKLFTLFASDDRALAHVTKQRRGIARAAERVRAAREFGVRVTFDEAKAKREAQARVRAKTKSVRSGAGFLALKKSQQDASRAAGADALHHADRIFRTLGALAKESQRRAPPEHPAGARVLLDAVFLVPDSGRTRFERAVRDAQTAPDAGGVNVVVTGPWPPYHFVGGER